MLQKNKIRQDQENKIQGLRERGIDPYPAETSRTHTIAQFVAQFANISSAVICGRIKFLRKQGKILFASLDDGTDKVQVVFKAGDFDKEIFKLLKKTLTHSDFIEVSGKPYVTQRGASTLRASNWKMLAKSLLQLPAVHFGFKDEDERYRKRYLDMQTNPSVNDLIKKRSLFWNSIREYMLQHDFVEVETPILTTSEVGAKARQFKAHHNALNTDVYLRISSELAQKKLLIGGLPKIFEIGRVFRNEGMSPDHAQDYTAFEFYEAYQDARNGIPMVIDLFRYAAKKTFGKLQFSIRQFEVDLGSEWEKLSFNQLIQKEFKINPIDTTVECVIEALASKDLTFVPDIDLCGAIDICWKYVQKNLSGPYIVSGIPYYFAPFGKRSTHDQRLVEEYKIIMAGNEMGHVFNELNDPIDQRKRLSLQQAGVETLATEKLKNADFVEALEYGMPPAFGLGCSERLFAFLADTSIREAQAFPLMRTD